MRADTYKSLYKVELRAEFPDRPALDELKAVFGEDVDRNTDRR